MQGIYITQDPGLSAGQKFEPRIDSGGHLIIRRRRGTRSHPSSVQPAVTAALIVAANPARLRLRIRNHGSVTCFLGKDATLFGNLLAPPTMAASAQSSTGGNLAQNASYFYRVTATTPAGESLGSIEQQTDVGATGTATNKITLNWNALTGATGYKIYGRATGAELLIASVSGNGTVSYIDLGTITPAGALPAVNTSANGLPILQNESLDLDVDTEAWWAIAASSTGDLRIMEISE